ncbi:glycosyltransferase family 4 protein [bacterium]|nr:glycosyltransferase family 4 protein [bacterium]
MTRPHVIIVVENLPVPRDYRVWLIATTLRSRGYEVTVVSPSDDRAPKGVYRKDGVLMIRHKLYQAKSWLGYAREYAEALLRERAIIKRIYAKKPFQVMHVCDPPDLLYLLAKPYQKKGVKLVFDHHDLSPELILAKRNVASYAELGFLFKLAYKLLLRFERKSVESADIVLATNASYQSIEMERDGLALEKSFVVRSGLRREELIQNREAACSNVPRLVYIGVMARQDGVDILLKALAIVKEKQMRVSLKLLGDGPEFENLKALAKKLNIESETEFLGFVQKDKAKEILLASDIGVTPDPKTPMNDNSTMLKTLDYMAAGLPQVLFDLKEHRATCKDAALYVEPSSPEALAEGITTLCDSPELRARLSQRSLARSWELAWEGDGEPRLLEAYSKA